MERITRELAEQSEKQRLREEREIEAFVEKIDQYLAALSDEEKKQLEREQEVVLQRIIEELKKRGMYEESPETPDEDK